MQPTAWLQEVCFRPTLLDAVHLIGIVQNYSYNTTEECRMGAVHAARCLQSTVFVLRHMPDVCQNLPHDSVKGLQACLHRQSCQKLVRAVADTRKDAGPTFLGGGSPRRRCTQPG